MIMNVKIRADCYYNNIYISIVIINALKTK